MRWEKKSSVEYTKHICSSVCWWSLGSRLGNVNRTAVDIYEQGSLQYSDLGTREVVVLASYNMF